MESEDWKRYRDDTLDIRENCTEEELEIFTDYLNQNVLKHKIVFEMVNSRENLPFLDVNIRLKEGYLIPEIYSKPTDSDEYLNPASCHPLSVTNNNPLGVPLRVRRNCSDRVKDDEIFKSKLIEYKAHLMHSGYDSKLIDRKFLKVVKRRRSKTITNKEQKQMKERKFNFVTDIDPEFPNIMSAIRSCLPTLHKDPQCKTVFPKKAFRTLYRRGYANLKELLASSKIDNKEVKKRSYKGSCSKCGNVDKAIGAKRELRDSINAK